MTDERTFPFISGDRIRLVNWKPDKWVRVGGYGQVYFIGTLDTGEEDTWFKNAEMAYNSEWELYAPAPDEQDVYVSFRPDETQPENQYLHVQLAPEFYAKLPHGSTVWKCRLTPEMRIYP